MPYFVIVSGWKLGFQHVTSRGFTYLEADWLLQGTSVYGIEQKPTRGVCFDRTCEDAHAEVRQGVHYLAMFGLG